MGGVKCELRWCRICGRVEEVRRDLFDSPSRYWSPVGEGQVADRLLALAPWIAEALAEIREGA